MFVAQRGGLTPGSAAVQTVYTTVFGWYCTFVLLRTGAQRIQHSVVDTIVLY